MTSLGIKQLSQMRTEVGRLVEDTSTGRQTAIDDALNNALMEVSSMREWDQLIEVDETGVRQGGGTVATLVSGQAEFPLPWNCMRLKSAHFQATWEQPLKIVGANELYEAAGALLNTPSIPEILCVIGRTAQYQKLTGTAAASLTVSSDTANANAVLRVHYHKGTEFTGGNHWVDLTTALWTTPVALPTTARAGWPIVRISAPAGWIGTVLVKDASLNVLASLQPAETSAGATNNNYQIADRLLMRCWPVPDADYPLSLIYWRRPLRLTEAEDQPEIPVSDFMVYKAAGTIARTMGDAPRAQGYDAEAQASLGSASTGATKHGRLVIRPLRGGILGMTHTTYRGAR